MLTRENLDIPVINTNRNAADTSMTLRTPKNCFKMSRLVLAISIGIFTNSIIIVNVNSFYDPLIELFENMIQQKFMDKRHRSMWTVVDQPEQVLDAIANAPLWRAEARSFAAI